MVDGNRTATSAGAMGATRGRAQNRLDALPTAFALFGIAFSIWAIALYFTSRNLAQAEPLARASLSFLILAAAARVLTVFSATAIELMQGIFLFLALVMAKADGICVSSCSISTHDWTWTNSAGVGLAALIWLFAGASRWLPQMFPVVTIGLSTIVLAGHIALQFAFPRLCPKCLLISMVAIACLSSACRNEAVPIKKGWISGAARSAAPFLALLVTWQAIIPHEITLLEGRPITVIRGMPLSTPKENGIILFTLGGCAACQSARSHWRMITLSLWKCLWTLV